MKIHLRQIRQDSFTVVLNDTIRDDDLSWKARGLLVWLMSVDPDWTLYKSHLYEQAPDGRDSVDTGLEELEDAGYVRIKKTRNDDGTFGGCDIYVSDRPVDDWDAAVDDSETPSSCGKPTTDATEGDSKGDDRCGFSATGESVVGSSVADNPQLRSTDQKNTRSERNTDGTSAGAHADADARDVSWARDADNMQVFVDRVFKVLGSPIGLAGDLAMKLSRRAEDADEDQLREYVVEKVADLEADERDFDSRNIRRFLLEDIDEWRQYVAGVQPAKQAVGRNRYDDIDNASEPSSEQTASTKNASAWPPSDDYEHPEWWAEVREDLLGRMSDGEFREFIDELCAFESNDGVVLVAKSEFDVEWVEDNHVDFVADALSCDTDDIVVRTPRD